MLCDGCGETRQDVLMVAVGTTLITINPNNSVPETDIRSAPFNLCIECRRSVKAGLISKIANYIRGVRRSTGT